MAKTRPYPDHTIEDAARKAGASVQVCWEVHGPKDTSIAWMSCLLINHVLVIVETFYVAGGGASDPNKNAGWEVFTPTTDNGDIEATIAAVLERCKPDSVPQPKAAQ